MRISILLCLLTLGATTLSAADTVTFKPGDQVAFMGDSITHGGNYHQKMQLFLTTRLPGQNLWTRNIGWSGHTAKGAVKEFSWNHPDPATPIVFVHYGMNDVGRDDYKNRPTPPTDEQRAKRRGGYEASLSKLLDLLATPDRQLVIMSPTIFDDTMDRWDSAGERPHLNAELARFGAMGRAIGTERGLACIDLHTPMDALNTRVHADNPTKGLTKDRVHPTDSAGSDIVFMTLLGPLAVPHQVYQVHLDANGAAISCTGAELLAAEAQGTGLSFTLREHALPYPMTDKDRGLVMSDFTTRYNHQGLTLNGLAAGSYALNIDDITVGTYTAEQFATGIELSTVTTTPQFTQALALRPVIFGRKQQLEKIIRTLNSMRANLIWAKLD
ncbi:MAG: GDSL-type esterase/lipase family protein, partial [Planctomycetota bacterium]|nr:GDSL-type esterase/lipase family protein [Planctomycetota bacterium]